MERELGGKYDLISKEIFAFFIVNDKKLFNVADSDNWTLKSKSETLSRTGESKNWGGG